MLISDCTVLTPVIITSQPQSLPFAARDRQRSIWESQDSGTQGHWVDFRLEVHSER